MLDEYMILTRKRRKKFNLQELIGPIVCAAAGSYLLLAALLGLLAR